jgi:hypothetical protein
VDAYWTVTLIVILMLGLLMQSSASLLTGRAERNRTARRLAAVEHQLEVLNERLGIVTPSPVPGVVEHLRQGRKIAAIKEYRELTGAGLAEAKAAVEEIARNHGI